LQRFRDAQLPYCARLEPLLLSDYVEGNNGQVNEAPTRSAIRNQLSEAHCRRIR
jgi:hypothetical protein